MSNSSCCGNATSSIGQILYTIYKTQIDNNNMLQTQNVLRVY